MKGYIYCLKDSFDNVIYVGCTINSLNSRLSNHITCITISQARVYKYMRKNRIKPTIHLLEEVSFRKNRRLLLAEKKWVVFYRRRGIDLQNSSTYNIV